MLVAGLSTFVILPWDKDKLHLTSSGASEYNGACGDVPDSSGQFKA